MAQNLSTSTYTLALFKAGVRAQSGSLSQQESQLIDPELIDIIHNSVLMIRTLLGRVLDPFYMSEQTLGTITFTAGFATITIATYSIADINGMTLYDPTLKEVPILPYMKFNALRSLYTATQMGATDAIATVEVEPGTPNVLSLAFWSGVAAPITTMTIQYPRNPVKVTVDADTIDLPDSLIPIAQDMATMSVFRQLSKTPPVDIENRVTSFVSSQIAALGLKISQ